MPEAPRPAPLGLRPLAWLALASLLLAAVRFLPLQECLQGAAERLSALGPWGPALFVLLYVAACVFLVPASLLTLGAGAVYGVPRAVALVSIAATSGATAAFLIGRYLARGWVLKRVGQDPRFAALDRAVADEGWKIVLLARLSPVLPFTWLNYGFGLTQIRLRDYFLASWAGMLPGILLYAYLGSIAGSLAGASPRARTPVEWAVFGAGLVATASLTVYLARLANRALRPLRP